VTYEPINLRLLETGGGRAVLTSVAGDQLEPESLLDAAARRRARRRDLALSPGRARVLPAAFRKMTHLCARLVGALTVVCSHRGLLTLQK
jgi:hypothetical protein